ncbi:RdRP domain-containing protein [Rhizoctonia solani AG-1 IA]|uniref:RNA-dependent RNA polymerase n=1 Tax=Thanatephorus cucumeris (strain AG1-IA) TaxID=983506 RepID=L8WT51_THACA|nr:RdRP domain-containing protein [Rhizoctonia solani AG-1 IA]
MKVTCSAVLLVSPTRGQRAYFEFIDCRCTRAQGIHPWPWTTGRLTETSKARSQRGLKRITRPLSQQFIRPTLASRIQSAKTEPKTPKRFKLSQEQPWIQSDVRPALLTQGKDLGTSAREIESCGPQIKHIEKTPKLGNTLLNDESRFEEPEDVVMTSLADEQLDQLEADSKISFTNHDWNLPKNMHKVAHSPSHQRVFDSLGLPWAVQWEVARLVGAHPELSWDDVPLEALEKLCGSSSESAPRVAEVLFGKHPYYKVINARERTIHPLGSASAEYDHEDMLLRINSVERLGCEGTYFGGKFEFQLQPPVVSTSCRFRRYLGSRRLIEVRFSEKEPRLKPQVLREYMVENALVINGRVFRAFYARRTIVYLVETNEALDRQEDELVGDQFRRSLRDFIEWHNPLYANPYQTLNKWSSRFALGFSTSRPGLMFAPSEIYYLPETVAPGKSSNSAIMTDGAGFINTAAMNQLTAQMKWSTAPVSVQARFGGSKGLFILHPNDRLLDNPPRIYIRPSQVKVKLHPDPRRWCASHRVLDVLTRNTMAVGTQVTDQVIINLSHNGVPTTILDSMTRTYIESASLIPYVKEGRFLQLWETIFTRSKVQELILKGLTPESMARAQGFKSIEKGQDLLDAKFTYQPDPYSGHPPSFETQALGLLQSGFDLKFTPLFNRIESIQKMILFGMDGKVLCQLVLNGLVDPLGILDVGEVFCGFGRPVRDNSGTDISTVLGPVLVSRNPCILPSDMRKVSTEGICGEIRAYSCSQVIAVECPELWAAGYTDVIVFSVKGERSLASMLAGGDYDGDTAILIWEEALVNQFTNSATHFADVDVSDHFVSNPKRMEEIPPDDFRSVLNALLAPLMPNQVGMYGNWHMTAAKVLGLDDPETVRLGNVYDPYEQDPRIVSKLSVIEDLKQALDVYRQKCENEIVALRPYRRYDPDLLEPYNRERELCTRIPELSRELDQIVAFVNKMKEEFDKGEFSIGKRHGPASFDRKTEPGKKYSRRQRQESEWAASEAYNTGLPKGLLHIRDEMVPRIAASYAYSQDQDCSPGFAFAVAWSQLCKIKAEKKGPITAMDPQFGSLMCISKRTRQQLDLIAQ